MDLSPGQQKAVFALVVVVLAALGFWLILPKVSHSHAQAQPTPTPSPTESVPSPAVTSTPGTATATPAVTGTGSVNIYGWLPFDQQGLAAAATVTEKFLVDYDTYSYTETAQDYVGRMGSLVTSQLGSSLQALYSSSGVAKVRNGQQQVSTGTAQINSLRSFGPTSLTFVVTANQHLVTAKGTSNGSNQYAITVTGSGTSWQVDNIELSSTGQF